ncbi:MAG: hypothetical protein JO218_01315, partial [Burkholderiales bacterium]|nr:hypothetical protein [Burkholderiales bacterium]
CAELYNHTTSSMNTEVKAIANGEKGLLKCISSSTGKCYFLIGDLNGQGLSPIAVAAGAEATIDLGKEPVSICLRTIDESPSYWISCRNEGWVLGPKGLENIHAPKAHT